MTSNKNWKDSARIEYETSKGEPREIWGFSFYDPLTKKQEQEKQEQITSSDYRLFRTDLK